MVLSVRGQANIKFGVFLIIKSVRTRTMVHMTLSYVCTPFLSTCLLNWYPAYVCVNMHVVSVSVCACFTFFH